jgi:hypothetical protein
MKCRIRWDGCGICAVRQVWRILREAVRRPKRGFKLFGHAVVVGSAGNESRKVTRSASTQRVKHALVLHQVKRILRGFGRAIRRMEEALAAIDQRGVDQEDDCNRELYTYDIPHAVAPT